MRTLKCLLIIAVACIAMLGTASSVQAKVLGDLGYVLFGGHREYTTAGVTIALDKYVPAKWLSNPALQRTTLDPNAEVVYRGTVVEIGVLVMPGTEAGRNFLIAVTDPRDDNVRTEGPVTDPTGKVKFDLGDNFGGLRVIGIFGGRYGHVRWNTSLSETGTKFIYVFVRKGGKYKPLNEKAIAVRLMPSFDEVANQECDDRPAPQVRRQASGRQVCITLQKGTKMQKIQTKLVTSNLSEGECLVFKQEGETILSAEIISITHGEIKAEVTSGRWLNPNGSYSIEIGD